MRRQQQKFRSFCEAWCVRRVRRLLALLLRIHACKSTTHRPPQRTDHLNQWPLEQTRRDGWRTEVGQLDSVSSSAISILGAHDQHIARLPAIWKAGTYATSASMRQIHSYSCSSHNAAASHVQVLHAMSVQTDQLERRGHANRVLRMRCPCRATNLIDCV